MNMIMKPTAVIDNGTGYTKMGFAGSNEPLFVVPTTMSATLDLSECVIGDSENHRTDKHQMIYPIRNGQINDWDAIERYWERCFSSYLRCDTEETYVLLTEPPYNRPENREMTGEIMFETFDVPGIHIGVQAVFSLISSWSVNSMDKKLTGIVIDSGDGVTHVVPVVDGYVIESAIQSVPVAGRDASLFVMQILRERGERVSLQEAQKIKEDYSYTVQDVNNEFSRYEKDNSLFRNANINGRNIELGYEQFMAPETILNPEIIKSDHTGSLADMIDLSIQLCPIDTRRSLYGNIILSGGSTMFKGMRERLKSELDSIIVEKTNSFKEGDIGACQVNVHQQMNNAVYRGGSLFASLPDFPSYCITRKMYQEYGSGICRESRVFGNLFG
eukprot:GHVP01054053.1.p1 GENE.GHVP01054053.1~~GHVP01054053.1.p1  ORF type:complete len:387 (+),score=68.04 GHVP01054053.1:152-1312(+)